MQSALLSYSCSVGAGLAGRPCMARLEVLHQGHLDEAGVLGGGGAAHRHVDAGDVLGVALRDEHAVEHLGVGDEIGRLGALLGRVDVGDDDVGLAALQGRQQGGEGDGFVGDREAEAFTHGASPGFDVETDVFTWVVGVERFVARRVRVDRVDQRLALELRILRLQLLAGRRGGEAISTTMPAAKR